MGILWYGGKIYTMKSEEDQVEAVFTNKGFIVDTGTFDELNNKYRNDINQITDLQGNVMYPGFVDSHLHIIGHGEKLIRLDLSMMTSPEQVLESLKERAKHLSGDEWLIGEGWNENQWEDPRIIHKSELDEICPNNPMMLTRVCRHAVLANSKAINSANIDRHTEDPQGGKIVRDDNGVAIGYFLDTAQELIKEGIPDVSEQYLTSVVKASVDDLLSKGLVGGHSEDLNYYGGFKKTLNAFTNAIDGEDRKFRTNLLVHHEVLDDMENEGLSYNEGTDFIQLGAVKIFSDGALGGRTAWLSEPYEDDQDNYGIAIHNIENLEELVKKVREKGMPIAVHAIGDQAALTVAKLIQRYPLQNGRRDRIIHAQIVNEELIELLKTIDVVLDIQPTFVASDFPWIIERIGSRRVRYAYAWKTLIENGIPCAGGSDAPIEEVNPLLGIEAAVLRRSNIDGGYYNETEQLTVYEAVSLYTKGSAYVISHENDRGQIAPGFTADFTVFNQDLFTIAPEKITTSKVEMTIINEQIVYQKQ
ncbi:amidohydrolase family protein [Aquibacillus halophilus]|uniref:Amidohydrolase family protein n=1 Tax=Aquibacillus halophilus TaxID=930132 RepID=A0A6A8DEB0_9BACI|nr:amidohydrolase [Aquibacillus halophilus]MRH42846.1 amidohydrolase family protein [Aquibacillus halophilus]